MDELITKQQAIDAILGQPPEPHYPSWYAEQIKELPPAEPKIIYCKDCRKHNKKVGFDENLHTVWKEDACPLASWRGKAQGHEFDYQYCAFGERRTE
jgi:hypothetical protein